MTRGGYDGTIDDSGFVVPIRSPAGIAAGGRDDARGTAAVSRKTAADPPGRSYLPGMAAKNRRDPAGFRRLTEDQWAPGPPEISGRPACAHGRGMACPPRRDPATVRKV